MGRKRVKVAKYTKEKNAEAWRKYREEQAKRTYGMWDCFRYVFRDLRREHPLALAINAAIVVLALAGSVMETLGNKYLVELALDGGDRKRLALIFFSLFAAAKLCSYGKNQCENYMGYMGHQKLNLAWIRRLLAKNLSMDYENNEKAKINDLLNKAVQACYRGASDVLYNFRQMTLTALTFLTFGGILSMLSPWLILIVGVPAAAGYYINRHKMMWIWNMADNWQNCERQLGYVQNKATNFRAMKDVQLYGMQSWFRQSYRRSFQERQGWYEQQDVWELRHRVLSHIVQSAGNLAAYAYVILLVVKGEIGAGDFVLYFNSIMRLSTSVRELFEHFSGLPWQGQQISYIREYLDYENNTNRGAGAPLPTGECEIEFRNVGYTYYQAEQPTLRNISFTLHKGERLALVGLNGAGKTTLIKLMCGLYDPTEGEILLNGRNVKEYNRTEYFRLFSCVFQDINVLPVTIAENVAGESSDRLDRGRVIDCLQKAGVYEDIMRLPEKENTRLRKSICEQATDLSGGQTQKLALAKALYKDAPVLLLDEPTAALDPLAEQRMYQNYAEFSQARASVFISHRLASTRFCDRILLLENGSVAEEGSHDELMRLAGKYAELFELQSSYYNEKKGETEYA